MRAAKPHVVRFVTQLAESVRQLLIVLVGIPSALCVPVPVPSSTDRATHHPPHRVARRF